MCRCLVHECICIDVQVWYKRCPLSTERYWTAQPERLHSAEVSDEQVGIQQLQLGGKLTSTVGAHPHIVDRSLKKRGLSLLPQTVSTCKLPLPPAEISLPSLLAQHSCSSDCGQRRCCAERTSTVMMHGWVGGTGGLEREGRSELNGEILILGNLYRVIPRPTPPLFFFFHLYVT